MSGARLLWTGPSTLNLLDRAILEFSDRPGSLWIVPKPLCRDQVEWKLAACEPSRPIPRVWTWEDLWAAVRSRSPQGPARLSEVAARTALVVAIQQARRSGFLRSLGPLCETGGYRRQTASRIAAWTRAGLRLSGDPPVGASPDDWEVFRRYRKLLKAKTLDGEDAEGFAHWAAGALAAVLGKLVGPGDPLILHDPSQLAGPVLRRALAAFQAHDGDLLINWPGEPEGGRDELFIDLEPIRSRLRSMGFTETVHPPETDQPAGLAHLHRELFRNEPSAPSKNPEGLKRLSAPRGEGVALVLAREVREHLISGIDPADILVLFPSWDEQADLAREVLRSWGLPVTGGPTRRSFCEPSVNAWLMAMTLPSRNWEASQLIRLLRHGQFRPNWPEIESPRALAIAADAIRQTRVFRHRNAIRKALQEASSRDPDRMDPREERRAQRAETALPILDRLSQTLEGLERPAPWREQAAKARALARSLGFDDGYGHSPLARLFNDLDDHAATLDALGRGKEVVYWDDFTEDLRAIVQERPDDPEPIEPGSVRLATIAEAEGAEARHLLLAGLEEGRFPDRDLINLDPDELEGEEGESNAGKAPLAKEMRRFLGSIAMARESLTWLVPSTDEKGQDLLRAGFLDDAERLFTAEAWSSIHTEIRSLDPILPADLSHSTVETCVRTVGRACLTPNAETLAELTALASLPEHRPALAGAASALRLQHRRMRRARFGPYEGRLLDPRAIRQIAENHGSNRPLFSASQLETLASCPFKYFLRHVLRLEPIEDRGEFDKDYIRRGLLVHEALETLHQILKANEEDGSPLPERINGRILGVINDLLDRQPEPNSDVEQGVQQIDAERLRQVGRRYARQFTAYFGDGSTLIDCYDFEVHFGQGDGSYPELALGNETDGLRLQGMIDRIDLIQADGRLFFRIIDYKTGACPSKRQVEDGLALQLPLYTLAVHRGVFADQPAEPIDAAYWGLRDSRGFTPALELFRFDRRGALQAVNDWQGWQERLETFVLALVDRLRQADFPVHPREQDCTRTCDYRHVCRIGQLRHANKAWPEAPIMPREVEG